MPDTLKLQRIELEAGRSSQATLLGREEVTCESLYISKPLLQLTQADTEKYRKIQHRQLSLFEQKMPYARIQ